ncbi:hypothetical protein BG015_007066 [Linnemannia schmuckeri]|uniref:Uncharacterized protein n=1 Tax=Linnemannia schmuckeri TaxID=64567 RepID=A0A9P5VBQ4_9FUNG|nr:hypothetical protein BG015_007066 [Linnemannia schmuckeri]
MTWASTFQMKMVLLWQGIRLRTSIWNLKKRKNTSNLRSLSNDDEEDKVPPTPSQMSWSSQDDGEQYDEKGDFGEDAYHAAQAEAVFLEQQAEEDFYDEQARKAYEMEQDHLMA